MITKIRMLESEDKKYLNAIQFYGKSADKNNTKIIKKTYNLSNVRTFGEDNNMLDFTNPPVLKKNNSQDFILDEYL